MRLKSPRIAPVTPAEWTEEQRDLLKPLTREGRRPFNIYGTLAHHPAAAKAFMGWGAYVLRRSTLAERDRELIILRTGFLCRSGYEWSQHVRIGKRAGLTDAEIARLKEGPESPGWSNQEQTLLRAADELHRDQFIASATWEALGTFLSDQQRMDVVFTVAQYTQVSMILNTFGVQLDEGLEADADVTDDGLSDD